MSNNILMKIFEHNNWANLQTIQACIGLSDEQLDGKPRSATLGSIRQTLIHLVSAQQGYLSLLSLPVEERVDATPAFAELQESARNSGKTLLDMLKEESGKFPMAKLRTK